MHAGKATVRLLEAAIRERYGCRATLVEARPVAETYCGHTVWEEVVHVFDLRGHPKARRCYAWEERWGVITVLHEGLVDSAADSVRLRSRAAAIGGARAATAG